MNLLEARRQCAEQQVDVGIAHRRQMRIGISLLGPNACRRRETEPLRVLERHGIEALAFDARFELIDANGEFVVERGEGDAILPGLAFG